MGVAKTPPPPPEAELIRLAREARGLSPEAAADATPLRLGGTRWRQIEKGYERLNPFKAVAARPKTLAHMAHVVGVSPERLEAAGRADAAEILREIELQAAERETAPPTAGEVRARLIEANNRLAGMSATEADKLGLIDQVLELAAEYRRMAREQGNSPDHTNGGRRRTA